jgi:hypothetical protein
MASKVFVLNNLVVSVNSFALVHYENIQRGSPFRLLGGTRSRSVAKATERT